MQRLSTDIYASRTQTSPIAMAGQIVCVSRILGMLTRWHLWLLWHGLLWTVAFNQVKVSRQIARTARVFVHVDNNCCCRWFNIQDQRMETASIVALLGSSELYNGKCSEWSEKSVIKMALVWPSVQIETFDRLRVALVSTLRRLAINC